MIEVLLWVVAAVGAMFLLTAFWGAPYVPTLRATKRNLFELVAVGTGDVVVDLGCGDGTILLEAAKRGAKVVGYEINPALAMIAWLRLRRYGGQVRLANMWRIATLPAGTSLVYYFGTARDVPKLEKCLRRWGGGYKVVSFGFEISGVNAVRAVGGLHVYEV